MKIEIISTIIKYLGKTFQVMNRTINLDKNKNIEFEFIKRNEVALVVPLTSDNRLLMIEHYRASINSFILEFPAGKKKSNESIEETAHRELKEETGFQALSLEALGSFYTAPHFTDEKVYIFIARILNKGLKSLEEEEIINSKIITINECINLYKSHEIIDAKTLIAIDFLIKNLNINA